MCEKSKSKSIDKSSNELGMESLTGAYSLRPKKIKKEFKKSDSKLKEISK